MTLQGLWSREQADDYGFIHTTPKQPIKRVKVLVAQLVKNPPAMQETLVRFLGQEDPLEKG